MAALSANRRAEKSNDLIGASRIITSSIEEKENFHPQKASLSAKSFVPSTPTAGAKSANPPMSQLSTNTPILQSRNNPTTPANQMVKVDSGTPVCSGQLTGIAPKRLDEWDKVLRGLPSATAQDRARLDRLYERALGSGKGNEELDVASHKDKKEYVSLWLRRIQLDPDEGPTYMKFVRNCGIGRKYAAIYVQQAIMFSHDKALKALQEGLDAGAQPIKLLQDIVAAVTEGKNPSQASQDFLSFYPDVQGMLGEFPDGYCCQREASITGHSASAPETDTATMNQKDGNKKKEDTVTFGSKKSECIDISDASSLRRPEAEETVVFNAKLVSGTPSQTKKPTIAAETAPEAVASIKSRPIRALKSLGLLGGARRVNPAAAECAQESQVVSSQQVLNDQTACSDQQEACLDSADDKIARGVRGGQLGSQASKASALSDSPTLEQTRRSDSKTADLSPITESEGADGGHGSEVNSSISSGGSNDSINRTRTDPLNPPHPHQPPSSIADETTQPHYVPPPSGGPSEAGHRSASISNDETVPNAGAGEWGGRRERDSQEDAAASRRKALCLGHLAQIPPESVPKGHIAVCGQVYKKVEVKGKGGGGKVYKVHRVEDEESVWAIKKIKLEPGDDDLRESVLNEIELLVRMRGRACIVQMHDYEVGDNGVCMTSS